MIIDPQRVTDETFVRSVEQFAELGSTNDYALGRAALEPLETPHLVLAERQLSGRGRGANRWWSGPGSLTFSLVIDPPETLEPARRPQISLTAGLAICEALQSLAPSAEVGLKWPNDVYLGPRKVCGILVEATTSPRQRLVLGVGVNVNNRMSDAPQAVRSRAASLADSLGCTHDPTDVLVRLLVALEKSFEILASDAPSLKSRWESYCLLRGRSVRVEAGGRSASGVCLGIDEGGALVLQTDAGEERVIAGAVAAID